MNMIQKLCDDINAGGTGTISMKAMCDQQQRTEAGQFIIQAVTKHHKEPKYDCPEKTLQMILTYYNDPQSTQQAVTDWAGHNCLQGKIIYSN